jgi:hypothetical protein
MVEGDEDARLLLQAREALGLVREILRQRLERDLAAEIHVPGAVDLAHASGPEPGDDLVGSYACSCGNHDGPPVDEAAVIKDCRMLGADPCRRKRPRRA